VLYVAVAKVSNNVSIACLQNYIIIHTFVVFRKGLLFVWGVGVILVVVVVS